MDRIEEHQYNTLLILFIDNDDNWYNSTQINFTINVSSEFPLIKVFLCVRDARARAISH